MKGAVDMKIKYKILTLAIFLFLSIFDQIYPQSVYTNFNFLLGFPQNKYKENVDHIGYGGAGSFIIPFGDSPFGAGMDVGVLYFNSEKPTIINTEGSNLMLESVKGSVLAHLLIRIQISNEKIRPYLEGLVGMQIFFSESTSQIGPIYGVSEDGEALSTNEIDKEFSCGISCGTMIFLAKLSPEKSETKAEEILLDLRVRYLFGGKTKFVQNFHHIDSEKITFDTVHARTNLFTLQIGISLAF